MPKIEGGAEHPHSRDLASLDQERNAEVEESSGQKARGVIEELLTQWLVGVSNMEIQMEME
jgi:hypothetical protein